MAQHTIGCKINLFLTSQLNKKLTSGVSKH